jgi:putative cardiolipin synthase
VIAALLRVGVLATAMTMTMTGCASIDLGRVARPAPTAPVGSAGTRLHESVAPRVAAEAGRSGFATLERGLDAFVARAALAELADRTLDLQYYIVHGDASGRLLLGRAWAAAERGVRVRLLVDDWTLHGADESLAQLDAHPGVEVRLFNPLANRSWWNPARWLEMLGDFGRINRRMHNKAWIADGTAAIVGGRNLGDEYFEARDDLDYRDLDLLGVGPVVDEAAASFERYWSSPYAVPLQRFSRAAQDPAQRAAVTRWFDDDARRAAGTPFAQALADASLSRALRDGTFRLTWGEARFLADDPAKIALPIDDPSLAGADRGLLLAGQLDALAPRPLRELLVVAPYFVPGPQGVAAFGALVRDGVRVRILTNSLASNDVTAAQAGYARYRTALLEAGVELHELRAARAERDGVPRPKRRGLPGGSSRAALHEKSFVVDRQWAFVGSLNLDPRSVRLNTEVGVLVRSEALAGEVASIWERNASSERSWRVELSGGAPRWVATEAGREVSTDVEPDTGAWLRLMQRIYGRVAPEALL